jgi:hypothetical protein
MADTENPLTYQSVEDLFTAVQMRQVDGGAGKGAEDIDSSEVIVPRMQLLQAMSKVITEKKLPGAEPGVWWLTPFNRPLNSPTGKDGLPVMVKMIVARILPGQKRWRKLEDGGGRLCESVNGALTATRPCGLAGAKINVERNKKKEVTAIDWEGGVATDDCSLCVYGLGAAATAAGREPIQGSKDRGTVWLPKLLVINGETVQIDDKFRAPVCTPGTDVIALVSVPAFGQAPAEIMPVLVTFAKTSSGAGKQLGSMLRMDARSPAWAKIYEIGSQFTTNERGTFSVANVRTLGYAPKALADQAADLYEASKLRTYNASWEDDGEGSAAAPHPAKTASETAPPPDPADKF